MEGIQAAFSEYVSQISRRFSGATFDEYVGYLRDGKDPKGRTKGIVKARKTRIRKYYRWDDDREELRYRCNDLVAVRENQIFDILMREHKTAKGSNSLHERVKNRYHGITEDDTYKFVALCKCYGLEEATPVGGDQEGVQTAGRAEFMTSVAYTQDAHTNIATFWPSREEFSDFPMLLRQIVAASKAGPHVGVTIVKVPEGSLTQSRRVEFATNSNRKCLKYFEQESKAVTSINGGVFLIRYTVKGPATPTAWKKLAGSFGDVANDNKLAEMLSGGRYKAVYVSSVDGLVSPSPLYVTVRLEWPRRCTVQLTQKLKLAEETLKLFAMDPIGLSQLPGNLLQGLNLAGMSSDYIYLGAPGSIFTMHIEDYNIHSFNYLRSGEPKRWIVINPKSLSSFENLIRETFPGCRGNCSQFVRHECLYILPSFLSNSGIDYVEVTQNPGDMLILFPFAYHQGYNMGSNIAIANNYALQSEEQLYEAGYVPCNDECHADPPLTLRFPLKSHLPSSPPHTSPS